MDGMYKQEGIFAIKFRHVHRARTAGQTKRFAQQQQLQRLEDEQECWKKSQPEIGKGVRIETLDGSPALMMPFIAQKFEQPSPVQKAAVKSAVSSFAERGFRHCDLSWRHVGYHGSPENPKAALLDLGHVEKVAGPKQKAAAVNQMNKALGIK